MFKKILGVVLVTALCCSTVLSIIKLKEYVDKSNTTQEEDLTSELDRILFTASRAKMLNEYNDTFVAVNGGGYMSGREVANEPNHYIMVDSPAPKGNLTAKMERPINKSGPTEPLTTSEVSVNEYILSETELYELAKLVYAEDGNQPIESQEAIVDSVLNLRDDPKYPDNIHDIIFRPGLYTVVSNGMYDRAEPKELTWQAIYNELQQFGGVRNSYEVKYFRTSHYHTFGTPLFNINNVYFSGA